MKIISQFEVDGQEVEVQQQDNGKYDVFVDGINKQPNHDADGIIRYLSNMAHNLSFQKEQINKKTKSTKLK